MKRHNYVLTSRTAHIRHIHKVRFLTSLHASILKDDLNISFSSEFYSRDRFDSFYKIDSEDNQLEKLLSYDSNNYFEYDFDRVLSQAMYNLYCVGKTYVEIAYVKDTENNVKGLTITPFDAIKLLSIRTISYFLIKDERNKFRIIKIPSKFFVKLELKGLGLKNNYFKKLVRRFMKMDKNRSTDFICDEKMNKIFDLSRRIDRDKLLIVKYPQKIGWLGRDYNNKYRNESYLLYCHIKYKMFRQKSLEYLLNSINIGLKKTCEEIGVEGIIVIKEPTKDYENEWRKYLKGEICTSELSSRVIGN